MSDPIAVEFENLEIVFRIPFALPSSPFAISLVFFQIGRPKFPKARHDLFVKIWAVSIPRSAPRVRVDHRHFNGIHYEVCSAFFLLLEG